MPDISQVSRLLSDRAADVARMLLPSGYKDGKEWRVGSVAGEKGQSLAVTCEGDGRGKWFDFATGEKGDLIDLWAETRSMTLGDALVAAKDWLGVHDPKPYREPEKVYAKPQKPSGAPINGNPLDYLRDKRKIADEVLRRYRVGSRSNEIVFLFLRPDGTLALVKTREAVDGAHPRPTQADCEPILFGWQAIPADSREALICEGEVDALSWATYGLPALSVPFGGGKGGKQNWIEREYERLERFERIYLATDMDRVGDEAAEEIASRLGRHRCYRVLLPHKDANDCLTAGVPVEEMERFVREAQPLDPDGLRRPSDFTSEVTNLLWPTEGTHLGYHLPYDRIGKKLLFRPAELTLWSGAAGSGKSQLISDAIPCWVVAGSRVCVASFEMKCAQTLRRLVKQASGMDRPDDGYIARILKWLDTGLLLYERIGKEGMSDLLAIFDYARAKYGCDQFVIDSLMRLGIAQDDYSGQEAAIFQLVQWTIDHNVHVHLVAHARKGGRDAGVPETEDVKGAMEIGANAFNIITVWRNRKHEESMSLLSERLDRAATDGERQDAVSEMTDLRRKPGVIINVAKQRNGDFSGKCGLWFNVGNYQYACDPNDRASRCYVE